jgi:hypothetical protein
MRATILALCVLIPSFEQSLAQSPVTAPESPPPIRIAQPAPCPNYRTEAACNNVDWCSWHRPDSGKPGCKAKPRRAQQNHDAPHTTRLLTANARAEYTFENLTKVEAQCRINKSFYHCNHDDNCTWSDRITTCIASHRYVMEVCSATYKKPGACEANDYCDWSTARAACTAKPSHLRATPSLSSQIQGWWRHTRLDVLVLFLLHFLPLAAFLVIVTAFILTGRSFQRMPRPIRPARPSSPVAPTTPRALYDYSPKARAAAAQAPPSSVPFSGLRDTVAAQTAMQIAHAYMREVHDDIFDALKNPALANQFLNTIALASKQLVIAEQYDPDATITIENKDSSPLTLDLRELKAHALFYEGIARSGEDPKTGVRVIEQACAIAPEAANFYFWAGLIHATLFNKPQAIAAFERAVAIDPSNIDYRKELDRAHNISGAQVAFDRAASVTRKTVSIARWIPAAIILILLANLGIAITTGDATTIGAVLIIFVLIGLAIKSFAVLRLWIWTNTR